jgi:hypothetical protein
MSGTPGKILLEDVQAKVIPNNAKMPFTFFTRPVIFPRLSEKSEHGLVVVAHVCDPSWVRGRDGRIEV